VNWLAVMSKITTAIFSFLWIFFSQWSVHNQPESSVCDFYVFVKINTCGRIERIQAVFFAVSKKNKDENFVSFSPSQQHKQSISYKQSNQRKE
jgi:hypothetical protein